MNPEIYTEEASFSLLDILGIYPGILSLSALLLGIFAIALRNRRMNISIAHALAGLAILGFGCTGWRMHALNSYLRPHGAVDPMQWIISLGNAWMPTGVVLFFVGIAFIMLALSWVFTKPEIQKIEGEQDAPSNH